jgi:hypothetical protein
VNAALTWLFDVAVAPAIGAAPLTTLLLMSVATGLAMLWVVGRTSNQPGIGAAKRGIQAALFEIRLFNDDLGAVMRALGRVLWQNLRYLGHSIVPLAWVALPLTLVIAQLQAFYGYDGLALGAPALLTMRTRGPAVAAGAASLQASDAIRVDTPAVVLSGPGEVLWRIVATTPGEHLVTIRTGSSELAKTVHVSTGAARRSPVRVSGLIDQLLYPSEPPLPADSVATEIALPYSEPGLEVLGWRVHWLVVYVVVSMITAFALARRLGVTL